MSFCFIIKFILIESIPFRKTHKTKIQRNRSKILLAMSVLFSYFVDNITLYIFKLTIGKCVLSSFQPPLWETYQQQLKDWECTINKSNTSFCNGYHEKAASVEKPPMFAFCLKPRGLEVFNKGSKQRSHRKFSVSGHSNSIAYDHEGLHGFGKFCCPFFSIHLITVVYLGWHCRASFVVIDFLDLALQFELVCCIR